MLNLKILSPYKSLTPFEWNNIPKLAVITGLNGTGKTHLLEYISEVFKGNPLNENIIQGLSSGGGVNYITSEWNPMVTNVTYSGNRNSYIESYDNNYNTFLTYFKIKQKDKNKEHYEFDRVLKNIYTKLDKSLEELSEDEVKDNMPSDISNRLKEQDDFGRSFFSFERHFQERASSAVKRNNLELIKKLKNEKKPCDTVNELLEEYRIDLRLIDIDFKRPSNQFIFKNIKNNTEIALSNLSSGEKMIVFTAMWVHNPDVGTRVSCILLDEPDAFLHPSMSKLLINLIHEKLVKKYGIQVFLTTHSPSTVAFSPEESLFIMNKDSPRIEKIDKKRALSILSDGIIAISDSEADLKLNYNIKTQNKPVLFVEGITDKIILEEAWKRFYKEQEMPFFIQDAFDCYFLNNLFKRKEIFDNYPNKIFIGLIDFDDAYKDFKNNILEKDNYEKIPMKNLCYKHPNKNGFIMCLPVPEFRKNYAGEDLLNSYLSIELLFEDTLISDFCDTKSVVGGTNILVFKKSKKTHFAEEIVPTLGKEEFNQFIVLFESLKTIITNHDFPHHP